MPVDKPLKADAGSRDSSNGPRFFLSDERMLTVRQFFFAVGKPHRPTDAKLTGEATDHSPEYP